MDRHDLRRTCWALGACGGGPAEAGLLSWELSASGRETGGGIAGTTDVRSGGQKCCLESEGVFTPCRGVEAFSDGS